MRVRVRSSVRERTQNSGAAHTKIIQDKDTLWVAKVPTYMVKVVPVLVRERDALTPLRPGAPRENRRGRRGITPFVGPVRDQEQQRGWLAGALLTVASNMVYAHNFEGRGGRDEDTRGAEISLTYACRVR